jgi:LPXTG-motif cell wall-anchored protein
MSNTTVGIMMGTGAMAGIALYIAKRRRRNRSILARTRNQALSMKDRAAKLSDSAAVFMGKSRQEVTRQKTGILEAIEAGKAAYLKVAG